MGEKVLMKGNEACAEAAIRAGVQCYFGYPITPQNELTEYMGRRMVEEGRPFIQSESELAAINMCFGASACGVRVMTSSSSPGISLKQEGISYMACAGLPAVIVNMSRGGPGLGNISPAQGDYFQSTRGGGHGDYRTIVLAPHTIQELADFTMLAFDLADKWRMPVVILADGMIGQMMEPLVFQEYVKPADLPPKDWALGGMRGERDRNLVVALYLEPGAMEKVNRELEKKYNAIIKEEIRYEALETDDADLIIVAYGTSARVSKSTMKMAREKGLKVGIFRPMTLWPYPYEALAKLGEKTKKFLTVEMSLGQMIDDVKIALSDTSEKEIHFYGRPAGAIPTPEEILEKIERII